MITGIRNGTGRGAPMAQAAARRGDSGSRAETHKERVDRELIELLNELRVALPGVQFLFAFLLIVPFQETREDLTDFQKDLYFVSLLAAALATVLLIAPAAQHRVLFRQKDKDQLLRRSNLYAFAGLVVLGVAICTAILLVVDVLFDTTLGWVAAAIVAVLLAVVWLAVPLWRRAHTEQDDPDEDADV
jgi:O-antigen/teichoic acid export membrane protein